LIELFIASIVQGITEFIPVSSSLHLIIYSKLFSNKPLSLILISSMHMGSAIALIIFLLFDLRSKYKTFINFKFIKVLIVATLPIFIVGLFFFEILEDVSEITTLMIFSTIFFGILLYISDYYSDAKKSLKDISFSDSLLIGIFQCFSLLPGVSRSASIIISSRFLKIDRESSILMSAILSAPVILGAFVLGIYKVDFNNIVGNQLVFDIALSLGFSMISSYIVLKIFYKYSRVNGFGFLRRIELSWDSYCFYNFKKSLSLIIFIPNSLAFLNLEPDFSPATNISVLLLIEETTFPF
jgi:undecaprenyl-diphosphatase